MKTLTLSLLFFLCFTACIGQKTSTMQEKTTNNPEELEGKSHYVNPIDQKTYSTEGEFKTYYPDGNQPVETKATDLDNIVLLNSDEELQASVDIIEVSELIKTIEAIFQKHFSASKGSGKIMLQVTLYKEKEALLEYATQENIDLEIMTAFEKEMRTLEVMYSKKHDIIFQVIFRVNQAPTQD